jgi:ABC-type uncharacterized transport system permease subunit
MLDIAKDNGIITGKLKKLLTLDIYKKHALIADKRGIYIIFVHFDQL